MIQMRTFWIFWAETTSKIKNRNSRRWNLNNSQMRYHISCQLWRSDGAAGILCKVAFDTRTVKTDIIHFDMFEGTSHYCSRRHYKQLRNWWKSLCLNYLSWKFFPKLKHFKFKIRVYICLIAIGINISKTIRCMEIKLGKFCFGNWLLSWSLRWIWQTHKSLKILLIHIELQIFFLLL